MKCIEELSRERIEDMLMEVISVDEKGDSSPMLKMLADAVANYDKNIYSKGYKLRCFSRLRKAVLTKDEGEQL